jgi:hypothetical protein
MIAFVPCDGRLVTGCVGRRITTMDLLHRLKVWEDPAIRDALAWYLEVTFGFHSPDITFCYPGGEGPLNNSPHGV